MKKKSIETESRLEVTRGLLGEGDNEEILLNGFRVFDWGDENVWKYCGVSCTILKV